MFHLRKIRGETNTRFLCGGVLSSEGFKSKSREQKRYSRWFTALSEKLGGYDLNVYHSANQAGTFVGPSHILFADSNQHARKLI